MYCSFLELLAGIVLAGLNLAIQEVVTTIFRTVVLLTWDINFINLCGSCLAALVLTRLQECWNTTVVIMVSGADPGFPLGGFYLFK